MSRGSCYVLTVKGTQKTLRKTLKAVFRKNVLSTFSTDTFHGQRVRRTVKAVETSEWVDFPGAAQVVQIRRTRTTRNRKNSDGGTKNTIVESGLPDLLAAHDRRSA